MPSRLESAAKRHHEAKARLAAARHELTAARIEEHAAREELAEVIVEEIRAGMRQVEIVRVTGYTRERIRQIYEQRRGA